MAEAQGTIASLQRQAADLDANIQQRDAVAATQHAQAAERIRLLEQQLTTQRAEEVQQVEEHQRYQAQPIADKEHYKVQVADLGQEMDQLQAQFYEAVSPTQRKTEPSTSAGGNAAGEHSTAGGTPGKYQKQPEEIPSSAARRLGETPRTPHMGKKRTTYE